MEMRQHLLLHSFPPDKATARWPSTAPRVSQQNPLRRLTLQGLLVAHSGQPPTDPAAGTHVLQYQSPDAANARLDPRKSAAQAGRKIASANLMIFSGEVDHGSMMISLGSYSLLAGSFQLDAAASCPEVEGYGRKDRR